MLLRRGGCVSLLDDVENNTKAIGMSNETPLISSNTSRSTSFKKIEIDPSDSDGLARSWPCRACGCLLGLLHLSFGVTILILDTLTSEIAGTAFSTTAALSYLISAVLCFIAMRRLDRCAQLLLFGCSSFSLIASLAIFLESGVVLNRTCPEGSCTSKAAQIYGGLIAISLSEGVTCVATMFVCYRSLRNAFGISSAKSPYSTLIIGDYRTLSTKPKLVSERVGRTFSEGAVV